MFSWCLIPVMVEGHRVPWDGERARRCGASPACSPSNPARNAAHFFHQIPPKHFPLLSPGSRSCAPPRLPLPTSALPRRCRCSCRRSHLANQLREQQKKKVIFNPDQFLIWFAAQPLNSCDGTRMASSFGGGNTKSPTEVSCDALALCSQIISFHALLSC